ncbi:MAG: hypothetical protein R3D55_09740 [Chloroflexota bacterium]
MISIVVSPILEPISYAHAATANTFPTLTQALGLADDDTTDATNPR